MHTLQGFQAYSWFMLAGLVLSVLFWSRLAKRDSRLLPVYLGAVLGAFLGAKLCYFLAEGWMKLGLDNFWWDLAVGKTILGALLGGYLGVEIAKKLVGYNKATGDSFAMIAPAGIILGRLGCWAHGCCLGVRLGYFDEYAGVSYSDVSRWPAVPAEIGFNLLIFIAIVVLNKTRQLKGQHFHLYLVAYGLFRFVHEFLRETPRIAGAFSGYHFLAIVVFGLGVSGWILRARQRSF